jgi:hypothetical protein
MKLDTNKIELRKINDNIYQLFYEDNIFKFWSPKILTPFGIDTEYNKYLLKVEFTDENNEHIHLKKIIGKIENLIKKKLQLDENEFKSVIKVRNNKNSLLEMRIKNLKNHISTEIEYEDKQNNYLKTIFDLPKQSHVKTQLEVFGIWDYREKEKVKEDHKVGLILYVDKIIVCK